MRIDIRGRGGLLLRDAWADGPATYLGIMVAGFPNLFTVAGPGSTSVLSMMIAAAEQHVDWIAACLVDLSKRGVIEIEATTAAQEEWTADVEARASRTLHSLATNSYYRGANVPGKPQRFPIYLGGLKKYREICDVVVANGYHGFSLGMPRSTG
jgi:cyclohexanone monooxygenase